MSGVLWSLLLALVALFVIAAIVLLTPAKLGFTVHTAPKRQVRVALRLLGGLSPSIPVHETGRRRRKEELPTEKRKEKKRRSRRSPARAVRVAAWAPQLVVGLLRPVHLERLVVDADIGLEDPADTGHLFGLITALTSARPAPSTVSVTVRPDFTRPRFSGELDAKLSVVPAAFIPPAVRFAWRIYGPRS